MWSIEQKSTFNLPNGTSRYLGYGGRGYLTENIPNITGVMYGRGDFTWDGMTVSGCFVKGGNISRRDGGQGDTHTYPQINFNAGSSNSKYTSTNEVRPLTLRTNVIIKY